MPARNPTNPYLALGVRPFINCCSVRTMHGGSLMLPQVRAAVDAASRHFVNLDELMDAAGKRIAELTGAEWGIVTCGSAAAVALGTAACVAGNDPAKMLRLPFTDGMVNRVIIPRKQRFAYDQAVRMIGCPIVEIDTREELDRALDEPVALIVLLGKQEHLSGVRLEEIASVAKPRQIPIMVDAASEHIERPSPWLQRGDRLAQFDGVRGEVIEPEGVDRVPRLRIVWDRGRCPIDGLMLRQAVLDGEIRVMLDDNSATENSIAVDPFQLQPGEAALVGDAVVAALRASLTNQPTAPRSPVPAVAGEWELRVDFLHGMRSHHLALEQRGNQ